LATYNNYEIVQWDIKNAFVYTDIDEEIYVKQPTGYNKKGQNIVCKLKKALYSLKQAPRLWYFYLANKLKQLNFEPLVIE